MRSLLTTALLLCGLGAAVRLSRAELDFRDDSATQVQAAVRELGATPNAFYFQRLSDLIPNDEAQFLTQALEADPRLTSARVALGLLEERNGNFGSAEQTLLEAAHYDRQYIPAWTLTNFYFRRTKVDSFWHWARRAAQLNYGNPRALLRLAFLEEPDPVVVLNRLQGGDNLAYAYLDFLIGAGRLDAAQALVPVLLGAKVVRTNQLLDLTTRQLQAGNVSWALKTWNGLCGIAPGCVSLDPEHGPLLSAGFESPVGLENPVRLENMDGVGFHPRLVSGPGITTATSPQETIFSFDGSQSDVSPLVEQPVPAPPRGKRYRLRYQYRSSATGAHWSMAGLDSAVLSLQQDWHSGEWTILAAPQAGRDDLRILKLRLVYRREPGTISAQGELRVRNLQLTIL